MGHVGRDLDLFVIEPGCAMCERVVGARNVAACRRAQRCYLLDGLREAS
jgi:hypothetical protein